MKASLRTVIVMVSLLLVSGVSVSAQRNTITRGEYYNAVATKLRWDLSKRIHRVETLQEYLENGAVVQSHTVVSEGLPPDRSRHYSKTVGNGKTTESEEITIEYMRYTRRDRGPWTKIDLRQQGGTGYGTGTGSGRGMSCTQYTVESTFLEGLVTRLFESVEVETEGAELKL